MRTPFRLKLLSSYLLLVILLGSGLYLYLAFDLEERQVVAVREHLLDQARVAALMAAKEIRDPARDAPMVTALLAKAVRARVTVIARDGTVIGDSEVKGEDLTHLENHAGRPEIREAAKSGAGSSLRYSATLHLDMLYVAVPFSDRGVVRLALPLSDLAKAKQKLKESLAAALAVAILASLVLSYLLSNVISGNLRTLAAAAARIGRGEFSTRVSVNSRDELGDLAEVLNDMAGRIAGQVNRLSLEKHRLDAIFRGMGEGVMVTDALGKVTLVNPAFCELFGSSEAEGKLLLEVSRNPDLNAACREVTASGTEKVQELTAAGKSILVHWVPLLEQEGLAGVVAVFHDITDIRTLERVRKDFVANVSHELRTPVAVIQGYAETLLSGDLEADQVRREHFLTIIHRHARRLSSLICDLLTLSELESGVIALVPEAVSLEGAVRHSISLVEQRAQEKGITLHCRELAEVGMVRADRRRLEQVLINLLDNAVKYSQEKGQVTVRADRVGDMVRIFVEDNGIGIPGKDLPRLFERFYRVDQARSREEGGTGLGLSIVKHLVQAQGGSVSVESTLGKGSVFSFTLKAADLI